MFGGCCGRVFDNQDKPKETTAETQDMTEAITETEAQPKSSVGLKYKINDDGKTCTVTGIGTCNGKDIIIGTYENLPAPVLEILLLIIVPR